jgi:hypothetical protein
MIQIYSLNSYVDYDIKSPLASTDLVVLLMNCNWLLAKCFMPAFSH